MPADRFYLNGPLERGASIELEGPEHHHLSRVMRIAVGEEVEIVNGRGALAIGEVTAIGKEATRLHLAEVTLASTPPSKIALAIPLMRPNKLEWIVEKGVELGAGELRLYGADYAEKLQLSSNQLERLRNLSISALKQSGSLFLPSLEILVSLKEALVFEGSVLFGDTRPDAESLLDVEMKMSALFATGPERGFSPNELALLQKEAKGVSLSPHILRAETAPLAALSILALRLSVKG